MAFKYKTKDGNDYVLPGVGRTVKGEITSNQKIENANFILVSDDTATPQGPAIDAVAPVQAVADSPAPAAQVQAVQPTATAVPQNQTIKEQN